MKITISRDEMTQASDLLKLMFDVRAQMQHLTRVDVSKLSLTMNDRAELYNSSAFYKRTDKSGNSWVFITPSGGGMAIYSVVNPKYNNVYV